MSENGLRVAIPSVRPGGVDAPRSGHFGRCDCFTVIEIDGDGRPGNVTIIENPPHVDGGCLTPVNLLASHSVNALIVAGIGARPLHGFGSAGIAVYHDAYGETVGASLASLVTGELGLISPDAVCGGSH